MHVCIVVFFKYLLETISQIIIDHCLTGLSPIIFKNMKSNEEKSTTILLARAYQLLKGYV